MSVDRSWCPICHRWVPASKMNYDVDDDGRIIRMCGYCIEGVDTNFVKEEHHEQIQCVYCDSYDTVELAPQWNTYKCNNCGETFRRFYG